MAVVEDYTKWKKRDLIRRIHELENSSIATDGEPSKSPIPKKRKQMDFSKYSTRKIAIRFAYLGWNYAGLAYQNDPSIPTIEGQILKGFYKTKMIASMEPSDCEFSRCGRTDKGVSALRQVICLKVRSNLTPDQQMDRAYDNQEIDYLRVLNSQLPEDIVAYELSLRPGNDFDARFSCKSRHYRYYFEPGNLNISAMNDAAGLFLGVHDFRNFCKVDGSKQITNFTREVLESRVVSMDSANMCYLDLKGTAFLWHQVRSMMAILFLIGQGLEKSSIITDFLDITKTPRRPVYAMAADFPLVLHDCIFPDIEWISATENDLFGRKQISTWNQIHAMNIKKEILTTMYDMVKNDTTNDKRQKNEHAVSKLYINTGAGIGRLISYYKPMAERETIDTPEVLNEKWLRKKENRNQEDTK